MRIKTPTTIRTEEELLIWFSHKPVREEVITSGGYKFQSLDGKEINLIFEGDKVLLISISDDK